MIVKEFCQYVRSYSELEGLQHAHTLYYSARRIEMGIVLELAQEQSGSCTVSRVLCPAGNFPQAMRVMRYLCENGIGPGQPSLRPAGVSMERENAMTHLLLGAPVFGVGLAALRLWRDRQRERS